MKEENVRRAMAGSPSAVSEAAVGARPQSRDVLGAISRRYVAVQSSAEEDWEIYKFLRDEESMALYVRHLRRCQVLKNALADFIGGGGL